MKLEVGMYVRLENDVEDIEDVITKEQFEQMKYRIGE